MTEARITDGEGRTKNMNPIRINAVRIKRGRFRLNTHAESQSMNAAMIAKFSPLTAVKCVRPTRRIFAMKLADSSEVSPRTNPGISAPASPPICPDVARKALRIALDFRCR